MVKKFSDFMQAGFKTYSKGYTAKQIRNGIRKLGLEVVPSEKEIRSYARDHQMVEVHSSSYNEKTHFVQPDKLEELLDGLGVPVRASDLHNAILSR